MPTNTLPPESQARRIEEASLNAWPALQQLLYDGWLLRLSRGFTKRANSIAPLRAGELPLARKLEFCTEVYRRAGLDPVFRLATVHPLGDLDARLDALGWSRIDPTLVLAIDLRRAKAPDTAAFVEIALDDWLSIYAELSGVPPAAQPLHRALLNGIALPHVFGAIEHAGKTVACGLAVVEDDVVGLFDVVTDPAARRAGHGTAVVTHLLERGAARGARTGYLQVVEGNAPARALYAAMGFTELYRYWYRSARPHGA
jgi:ribosomal protein S18 acetylase RimI-like enzyme